MFMDVWGKLWELARDVEKGQRPGTIEIDPSDSGHVTIVYQDGSRLKVEWFNGQWEEEA